ncbi:MAG TPA: DUF2892 domain-containing protein [Herpetosiphonaceae bacterium]
MTPNMGMTDRVLRFFLAAVIAVFYFLGYITGFWVYVLGFVAAVFVLTSIFGYCPLYTVFGFSTNERTIGTQ